MQYSGHKIVKPSASLCYGRDDLCLQVIRSAFNNKSLLLFGGRQSGKTTILLRILNSMNINQVKIDELVDIDIAVYVDLMRLPYDATPLTFFRYVTDLIRLECSHRIIGFKSNSKNAYLGDPLESFMIDLNTIFRDCGEVRIRVLLLLDESKRILNDRFTRAFQDNLFFILYGYDSPITDRISIVFSGAQDLYSFFKDGTSPISSRAAIQAINNLGFDAIYEIAKHFLNFNTPDEYAKASEIIYKYVGGQAGLSCRLTEQMAQYSNFNDIILNIDSILSIVTQNHKGLLRLWALSLSEEARIVAEILSKRNKLSLGEVSQNLKNNGKDYFLADRVCEELQYTGIIRINNGTIQISNLIYWNYFKDFSFNEDGSEGEKTVWTMIEKTELSLRDLIKQKYSDLWKEEAETVMRKILGEKSWRKIKSNLNQSQKKYPYSKEKISKNIIDCMYFAQLITLMVNRQAWSLFSKMFRDKRQLEDFSSAITPVRNDKAHFSRVPLKELDRCRIACDDLLVIIEKAEFDH